MKQQNKKITGKQLAVRILAIVLAVLMVVGIAYYTIAMIADGIKSNKDAKDPQKQEQPSDSSGNHNHDHEDDDPDDKASDIFD